MKFQIGDKVKVLECKTEDNYNDLVKVGDIGVVSSIVKKNIYPIEVSTRRILDYGFREDELELVKSEEEQGE